MRRNPYFFLLVCLGVEVGARKHHLIIENDVRQSIPLSTFGFYQGGNLHVNLSGFHPTDGNHYDLKELLIGFSIDRTLSDGLNPYMEDPDRECILSRNIQERDTAGIIRFQLNFNTMMTEIRCSKNVQSIAVTKDIAKREDQDNLSDQNIFPVHRNGPRRKRNMKDPDIEHFFESPLDKEIAEANSDIDKNKTAGVGNLKGLYAKSELLTEKLEGKADPKLEDSLGLKEKVDTKDDSKDDTQSSENDVEQPVETKSVPSQSSPDDACSNYQIPINLSPSGYQTSFQIFISDPSQEGLYSMFFHNCHQSEMIPVDFDIKMEEKNIGDNYLSAGEMPLPALYQMLSILFLLTGVFWVFILKKNGTEQVFRYLIRVKL
ncbi:protein GPR107 [Eurytemora carolleeae]|uniref:protein GPR107 n=1 Tax=Eurytemora carolleeae TaxID=1294199 RepID=UPI000C7740D2|nr:protein GPR107 [Eurytemora carolleeae]|eukprot:XP_023347433.1 protein GPR107-like [Eurytemora affinis]